MSLPITPPPAEGESQPIESAADASTNAKSSAFRKKSTGFIFETVQVILISLAIILPVRYFLIQPFYVKGASMEPNFHDQQYLIIDELSYRTGSPQRGDVVVFRYPLDPKEFFIKRVIGLPGETVEVANGKVKIENDAHPNGFILDESPYLTNVTTSGNRVVTLTGDQYYLLGDNRPESLDSRIFGPVDRSLLIGRVWVRGYPFDQWTVFHHLTYPTATSTP